VTPRQPVARLLRTGLGGSALARTVPHRAAHHRPAHHQAGLTRQTPPDRAPLWRRSPAVPAAVAVLAVWSGANLPHMLSPGPTATQAAQAASSETDHSILAAGGALGVGGALAAASVPDTSVPEASDATTATAARLAADSRVSRSARTLPRAGSAASKAPARRAAVVKPAPKPVKPAISRWVRPSAGGQSSCFCMRWGRMHNGIDLAGPNGSPIVAVGDGVVAEAGPAAGYGMWVAIRHSNGDYSIYGHMYQVYVTVGQHVRAGHHIADIGSNGHSTGPHLHFEITRGSPTGVHLDPAAWLRDRGVEVGPYNPNA
jgi:murein DD-endopeptidase MepM/ murein hydrolase activator NlpD